MTFFFGAPRSIAVMLCFIAQAPQPSLVLAVGGGELGTGHQFLGAVGGTPRAALALNADVEAAAQRRTSPLPAPRLAVLAIKRQH